jgi:hypothetical protein
MTSGKTATYLEDNVLISKRQISPLVNQGILHTHCGRHLVDDSLWVNILDAIP